ncbi:MAG: response regulator, partial [Armatimonadetes bacterium]|nr:response regulator [Armatimonadota bacterium]NIM23107.1 response regulator [Armatimonadota bacterium]NIM66975.1 response regulator [Armatimonadota bacterium]NIM75509.1 response regulator [Armatimonadota bacterium]NIN05164.1 response regulator [Armatimonadota bacterium]
MAWNPLLAGETERKAGEEEKMGRADSPTILIVEDDMLFQSIYRARLTQEGYSVKVASDGEDALREMETSPPDIVLLDLVLPRLSGYEVLTRMRANPTLADVPVIVLTNKGEPEDVQRGMEKGATDYLIKTVAHPKEVVWKIRQAISEKAGEPVHLRVAVKERELDAPRLAEISG